MLKVSGVPTIVKKAGMACSGSVQRTSAACAIINIPTRTSTGAVAPRGNDAD